MQNVMKQDGICDSDVDAGDGSMPRYKNNNDQMYLIWENIGVELDTSWETPDESIIICNYRIMNDTDSNWEHRDNILNLNHCSVSIGIAMVVKD